MRKEKHQIEWKEGRRRRAWELSQQGWKQKDIAAALGVSKGAVRKSAQAGQAGRGRSVASASGTWSAAQVERRGTGTVARRVGPRGGGVWFSGPGVDERARGAGHQAAVRGEVSSRAL